jgi:hypothetical protein
MAPVSAEPVPWRCAVCTFMNSPEKDMCNRCKEPVTAEQKAKQTMKKEREIRAGGEARVPEQPVSKAPAPLKPAEVYAAKTASSVTSQPAKPAGGIGFSKPSVGGGGGGGGGGHQAKISKANIHGVVQSRCASEKGGGHK